MAECPVHGREKVHNMVLNDRTAHELMFHVFSCGRFISGKVKDKVFQNEAEFMKAVDEYFAERKKTIELYRHFGFDDLIERMGL